MQNFVAGEHCDVIFSVLSYILYFRDAVWRDCNILIQIIC